MDLQLLGIASAFGLATSAGLNTTLPLLIVGILARLGHLDLADPYDALASNLSISGLAVLALLEFVADKLPGLDSAVEALQWPLAAAAGAILFASQTDTITWVSPELAIFTGLFTAGAVHGARTAGRPAVTVFSGGTGNPVISAIEDGASVLLAVLAVALPLLGLLLALALAGLLFWLVYWALRRGGRLFGRRNRRNPSRTLAEQAPRGRDR